MASTRCSSCGHIHDGLPFSFAAEFPDPYHRLDKTAKETRAMIASDQCVIDDTDFFIRGCIEIPIQECDDVFLWGVWAKVHEADYDLIADTWELAGREEKIGPFKGRIVNELAPYPPTFNLISSVKIREVGVRPKFVIEDKAHPLFTEQRNGIPRQVAETYSCLMMR